MQDHRYSNFAEFYPFYLSEHTHPTCRKLHFVGTWLVVAIVIGAIASGTLWWLLAAPLAGYGFAWIGHYFFEHNRPATFKYPLYSFIGDWVMWKDLMIGREKFNTRGK